MIEAKCYYCRVVSPTPLKLKVSRTNEIHVCGRCIKGALDKILQKS
jgi:hypothetical protein